jgi:hypothetical protein
MDPVIDTHSFAFISVLRTMDLPAKYSLTAGGIFSLLLLAQLIPRTAMPFKGISLSIPEHVIYPYALERHRSVGSSRSTFGLYRGVFCLGYQAASVSKAGLRTGTLSLISMVPLFAGPHLGFLADILGLSLNSLLRIHRSAGWMSFFLALFHVFISL